MGGINERKRRARKEVKQDSIAPQEVSSSSSLSSLLDPTPAEAMQIIRGEKEKEKKDSPYLLPRHHRSPPGPPRRSPRAKRVSRKDPSIDRLFLEVNEEYQQVCDQRFWDPVIVNPIQGASAAPGNPGPTAEASSSLATTLGSAPITIKEEMPQPEWYNINPMPLQEEDIYMSSPSEGEGASNDVLQRRPLPSNSTDLILPLMSVEEVERLCGQPDYTLITPCLPSDAMEVDQQQMGELGSSTLPIQVSSGVSTPQRSISRASTPYVAPSDSSPPFSPVYAVPSSNLVTPPYSPHSPVFSPHSPSTTPPPREVNQNFSFEVSAERMRELLEELQERGTGYTPLLSPPLDSFLTDRDPMIGATSANQDAVITSTSTSSPAATKGLRERLEKVKTQQQDCEKELEVLAGIVSKQRQLLDTENTGSPAGSVTRELVATVPLATTSEPRSEQETTPSPSPRNPIKLTWKQDSDSIHNDISNILPQIFDPFTEVPIRYQEGPHGIRLCSQMIKNNDEFLVNWKKMGASLFSFVVNNFKGMSF